MGYVNFLEGTCWCFRNRANPKKARDLLSILNWAVTSWPSGYSLSIGDEILPVIFWGLFHEPLKGSRHELTSMLVHVMSGFGSRCSPLIFFRNFHSWQRVWWFSKVNLGDSHTKSGQISWFVLSCFSRISKVSHLLSGIFCTKHLYGSPQISTRDLGTLWTHRFGVVCQASIFESKIGSQMEPFLP